jgi:hypothetical protein
MMAGILFAIAVYVLTCSLKNQILADGWGLYIIMLAVIGMKFAKWVYPKGL